jgi:hypothetical protein
VAALAARGDETRTLSYTCSRARGADRRLESCAASSRARAHAQGAGATHGPLLQLGSDFTWEMDAAARVTYVSPAFEAPHAAHHREFACAGTAEGAADRRRRAVALLGRPARAPRVTATA